MKIIDQHKIGNYLLISLQGDIRNYDVNTLAKTIRNLIRFNRDIIIDFEECERIHSSALAFFLNTNISMMKQKSKLILCHPPYDFQFVLQLLDLENHIFIIKELDEILKDEEFENAVSLSSISIEELTKVDDQRQENMQDQQIEFKQAKEDSDEREDIEEEEEQSRLIPKPKIYHVTKNK